MRPIGIVAAAATGMLVPIAFALPAVASPSLTGADSIFGAQSEEEVNGDANEFDGTITIYTSGSVATGDVAILVDGEELLPFMEVELNSPGLEAACSSEDLSGTTVETDRLGTLDATASADNCVPGTYRISVSQLDTPFQTESVEVTID